MNFLNRALFWARGAIMDLLERFPATIGQVWVRGKVANYLPQDSELVLRDNKDGHYVSVYIEDFERDMRDEGRPDFFWASGMECHAKGTPTTTGGKVTSISDITALVVFGD